MKKFSEKLARFIEQHPLWFVIIAAVISVAAIPGLTMLETETGFSALVSPDADISVNTARYQEQFGGDSINVLLTGPVEDLFSPENLDRLSDLEDKISGDPTYLSINSPLAILKAAVLEVEQQSQLLEQQLALALEEATEKVLASSTESGLDEAETEMAVERAQAYVQLQFHSQIEKLEQIGELSLDNPLFIRFILYDDSGEINPLIKPFVPDENHCLVYIIPRGNMSDDEALQATLDIQDFLLDSKYSGIEPTVISASELVNAISESMSSNFAILLGLSVLAMIIILVVLFRVRWRLLSLLMVGISTLWTFGLMGYLSVPLTMASMAMLPILIGLGIDFSIQFHNRYQEELTRSSDVSEAIVTSISRMFPVVGIALIATIIGFITLFVSEVPMVRDFGMMLAVGISICFLVGLFVLNSIVYISDRNVPLANLRKAASKASSRIEKVLLRMGKLAINHTAWIFIIAILFAAGGAVVDHMLPINTDYEELMPQDNEVLLGVRELREIAGAAGSVNFLVEADDVTTPEILNWMKDYEIDIILKYPGVLSANSPADIIIQSAGTIPPASQIPLVLNSIPEKYLERSLSGDRKMAVISFTVGQFSFEEIRDLIQHMQDEAALPDGVTMSPVGSFVMGAWTMDAMVGSRMTMNLICLGAIFVILLLLYRRLDTTLFLALPVGAVIAWSSLDMYLLSIPLNPLTAILGVIVIGICTEFMVLLMGRYAEEKALGLSPEEAMVTAISRIGRAITTTAMTTLGGFGVLIVSNFVLIRQFGIATFMGVLLCLVITLTVMPGVIVWYDNLRLKRQKKRTA